MKNKILYTALLASTALFMNSCSEDDFSKDYDIDLPVARIHDVSDKTPFIEEEIVLDRKSGV